MQSFDIENISIFLSKIGIILIFLLMGYLLYRLICCTPKKKIVSGIPPPPSIQFFGRSRSETIAINAFANILFEKGYDWNNIKTGFRPDFLRNPNTGKCLEIDAYFPEIKVGIEYNGIQHYKFPNHVHLDNEEGKECFEKGLERDRFKHNKCKELGINLIEIPYYIDSCELKNNEWVFKKFTDKEKWIKLKTYIEKHFKD